MGYTFAADARGFGYASEAAAPWSTYLFDSIGVLRVEAWADIDNVRSRHLLERIGFTYAGIEGGEAHYATPPL